MVARLAALAVVVLLGTGAFWYYRWRVANPAQQSTITPEAKAYTRNLGLSDVKMEAKESFTGGQLVEITGKIANNGERPVAAVEVTCVFYDPYGQEVLRERVAIVKAQGGGLKPGETKPFRLPFDTLPASWNQGPPQLVIASIRFS